MHIQNLESIKGLNDSSYFELLFLTKKLNKNDPGVSIKTKKAKIDSDNNINFSNSKIEFMSINIDEDIIDIFLLHNSKKILSNTSSNNYYRIISKDIGVKDSFQDIVCKIVNDIEVTISIKFKNKFSSGVLSMKDRLKFFNQSVQNTKKTNDTKYIPKKKGIPDSMNKPLQNNPKQEDTKKGEEPKNEEIKKEKTIKKEVPLKENNNEKSKNDEQNKEKNIKENNNDDITKEKRKNSDKLKSLSNKTTDNNENIKFTTAPTFNLKDNFGKTKITLNKTKTLAIRDNRNRGDDFEVLDLDDDKNEKGTSTIFVHPRKYGDYLEEQYKKNIKHPYRETFCEGFFIASFPKQKANVIEINTSFMAQCHHEECSKLPGMKPEIIFRYPLKDTKTLELNNLAATICFPTGIKVCYEENDKPKEIKDYVTSITNQKGERYYMMTYHFYLKMDTETYNKQYEENPLKHNLRKFADAYIGLNEEDLTEDMINEIQNNLEWNSELANRDIVSIPFCICLISKYPYVQEMKSCLKCIYTILNNETATNSKFIINDIIMYLINSIPIPAKNTKVKFLLPFSDNNIELDCPKLDDINIMNLSASKLLKYFTIDNLIIIFKLLITEKKILLIDNDYEKLSTVADGLVSILYPLKWVHTYIPIMSDQMLKYLETFLPFLNGINESLMSSVEKVFTEGEVEEDDEVFLIYIKENKIKLSSTLRGKIKKFDKYIQDNIPAIPGSLEKELKSKLKKAKTRLDEISKYKKEDTLQNNRNLELQIRDAFIDVFVEMFQDYAKYLSFVDQDTVFNKALFLEKKSSSEKKFYNEIIDTQLFQQFTQNVVNEDVGYFNKKIALKESGRKNADKKKSKTEKIEKEYIICPDFLNMENNSEYNLETLMKTLKEKFPENNNNESVLIMDKRVIIKDEDYNEKNCDIYFTQEELEAKQEQKKTVSENIESKNNKKMTNNIILQRIKAMNLKANIKKKQQQEEMS